MSDYGLFLIQLFLFIMSRDYRAEVMLSCHNPKLWLDFPASRGMQRSLSDSEFSELKLSLHHPNVSTRPAHEFPVVFGKRRRLGNDSLSVL